MCLYKHKSTQVTDAYYIIDILERVIFSYSLYFSPKSTLHFCRQFIFNTIIDNVQNDDIRNVFYVLQYGSDIISAAAFEGVETFYSFALKDNSEKY